MPHQATILNTLLKCIDRRAFKTKAEGLRSDAYVKSFGSWEHLVALVYAQFSGAVSLREIETSWNASSGAHYHLGGKPLSRSTLSDANRRRDPALFAGVFSSLSALAERSIRRESEALVRLIDSSPVPLNTLHDWRASNGRIKGAKLHMMFDPDTNVPLQAAVTLANVNDVRFAQDIAIERGATYVFDKGYTSLAFWQRMQDGGAVFLTRTKSNAALKLKTRTPLSDADRAAGVTCDHTVVHDSQSKGRIRLGFTLRRIRVRREDGKRIELITNDLGRAAHEIAALYRQRWQIELLFRWIKQHLKIRKFLGRSQNAVKNQIFAALIAFVLVRIAAAQNNIEKHWLIRFIELIGEQLFSRKPILEIAKPPDKQTRKNPPTSPQLSLGFCS